MKKWLIWLRWILVTSLIVLSAWVAYLIYEIAENHSHSFEDDNQYVYIPSGAKLEPFLQDLYEHPLILNAGVFKRAASWLNFREKNLRPGRYKIPKEYSYFSLIQLLKNGEQSPVNVVLNNERTPEELAEKVARYLEPDRIEFQNFFYQTNEIDTLRIAPDLLMTYIIPNTYQFLWNTGPDQFLARMIKEHNKFWSKNDRLKKADSLGLSPQEIYILASIVEKETRVKSERPRVAGLYLNRLRDNMKLQADPTVIFAMGDFSINRVLYNHLQFDSPYNTYLYEGLPPGPISMASINSIDAVLNAEDHEFVYMCAKPDLNGGHLFAKSYTEHLRNAAVYREWLAKYLKEKQKAELSRSNG